MSEPTDDAVYRAMQVLSEHLTRAVSEDLAEASGLKMRGRSDELRGFARSLARAVDAYGPPARDVLTAVGFDQDVVVALDRPSAPQG